MIRFVGIKARLPIPRGLTTLTQKWVAGDVSNQGVMLYATNEETDGKDLRFHSSKSDSTSKRPKLDVTYTEDPLATVFFLKDHLGSVRAVVDDTAGVVGNTIRYNGAFPGIDVVYEYLDTRLKQTIVLSAQARRNLPNPATLGLAPAATFVSIQSEYDLPDSPRDATITSATLELYLFATWGTASSFTP